MWYDWEKNCLFSIPIQGCICVGLPEDTPLLHRPMLRPRRILMSDPNWNNDRYYGNSFPRVGMQHARYIGVTFGRGFLNTARLRALLIYAQVFTVCYLLQGGPLSLSLPPPLSPSPSLPPSLSLPLPPSPPLSLSLFPTLPPHVQLQETPILPTMS